jgi:hypothetical protein
MRSIVTKKTHRWRELGKNDMYFVSNKPALSTTYVLDDPPAALHTSSLSGMAFSLPLPLPRQSILCSMSLALISINIKENKICV